jgi:hypothetical protein
VETVPANDRGKTARLGTALALSRFALVAGLSAGCGHESAPGKADYVRTVSAPSAKIDSAPKPTAVLDSPTVNGALQTDDSLPPLRCIPNTFGPSDTLTLQMRTPHGDYLTVTPPKGTVHFIVYPQWGIPRRRYSLLPSEDFRRVATLKLPSNVQAIARVINRDTIPEQVFSEPGEYVLRMGENLEGDYGNVSYTCALHFVAPAK